MSRADARQPGMPVLPAPAALTRRHWLSRSARAATLPAVAWLAAGCSPLPARKAAPADAATQGQAAPSEWRGRLGLQVASEPPESYSAGFELRGNPTQGSLQLYSPLGSTLAELAWQPGSATLRQGSEARHYGSLDELAAQATGGTPLPIAALFGWLQGQPQDVPGWSADLSRLADGRLQARRTAPLPTADLRLVLER